MSRSYTATNAQKEDYNSRKPVYPLYGYIECDVENRIPRPKMTCPIEYVGDATNSIKYEVMAPRGYHFSPDYTHTLLCSDLKDVRDRVNSSQLQPCGPDCGK
jgi:hypothetical protein